VTASFAYHDPPDVPPGMTLSEYRLLLGELRRPRRRGWRRRLLWWRRRQLRQPLAF